MMKADSLVLRFGIPALDEMLGFDTIRGAIKGNAESSSNDKPTDEMSEATSLCIAGGDGVGKSVLALHLASRYAADCLQNSNRMNEIINSRILYVSTDLKYSKAIKTWENFNLLLPNSRKIPFYEEEAGLLYDPDHKLGTTGLQVSLIPCVPTKDDREPDKTCVLSEFILEENQQRNECAFLDLASKTSGDDWGTVIRAVAALPAPNCLTAKHLVVIDAVEGLELMAGEIDVYGQKRSRRSRIAQLMRVADKKCHLVFLVEEPRDGERLVEEFLTDTVIRLRSVDYAGYLRRTIEITKARGLDIVRGQHQFSTRSGSGSTTGEAIDCNCEGENINLSIEAGIVNWDDPRVPHDPNKPLRCQSDKAQHYFHVVHSIDKLERWVMKETAGAVLLDSAKQEEIKKKKTSFGITYLDNMLTPRGGLPAGSVTALIGDDGTHKSRLGRAFLSGILLEKNSDENEDPGIGILLTMSLVDVAQLSQLLPKHRSPANADPNAAELVRKRILCRRLEIHDMSPAVFMHIVRSYVEKAKRLLHSEIHPVDAKGQEYQYQRGAVATNFAHRIRLVIDDWSVIRSTYPDVANDAKCLPFLIRYLKREGISVLIIDTQPGRPGTIIEGGRNNELRSLARHHIYTWSTPFQGQRCVAISAIPPISDEKNVTVRELKPAPEPERVSDEEGVSVEKLVVDPHFELYQGIEDGQARRIPLSLQLYAETQKAAQNLQIVKNMFKLMFGSEVVEIQDGPLFIEKDSTHYEQLRDYIRLRAGQPINNTVVVQTDEYWATDLRDARQQLCNLRDYVTESTDSDQDADPFSLFQEKFNGNESTCRLNVFNCDSFLGNCAADDSQIKKDIKSNGIYSVPLTWDFNFLLVRKKDSNSLQTKDITWRKFLWECRKKADDENANIRWPQTEVDKVIPVHIEMSSPETLSCFFLTVLASEIYEADSEKAKQWFPKESRSVTGDSLADIFEDSTVRHALYNTWLMMRLVLNIDQFLTDGFSFKQQRDKNQFPKQKAIAEFHWFSTACAAMEHDPDLEAVSLPGKFTVRGDWNLSVIRGSRSERLGHNVLDLLSSKRANIRRLQHGVGLPTRILSHDTNKVENRVRTALKKSNGTKYLYKEVKDLGPEGNNELQWLWRSNILHYDRSARTWNKWLCRILGDWDTICPTKPSCDVIEQMYVDYKNLPQYHPCPPFEELCDYLCDFLRAAAPQDGNRADGHRGQAEDGTDVHAATLG